MSALTLATLVVNDYDEAIAFFTAARTSNCVPTTTGAMASAGW